jgi:hypothetical protein
MLGNSRVAVQMAASQEGLSSMELISYATTLLTAYEESEYLDGKVTSTGI